MRRTPARRTLLFFALLCIAERAAAAAPPVLDPVPAPVRVGASLTLHGSGITPGSVLKVFLATAGGPVDVSSASGLAPSSTTATSFTVTLPWPWPVSDPNLQFSVGNGFVSLELVRTDMSFDSSNVAGAVLLGNDSLGVPSVTGLGGVALSTTSTDPAIGLANVETVVARGATLTIQGSAFASSKVNIFTATGNIGPLSPSAQTATSISVLVPANAPIGPGSVQVVNAKGKFRSSNAVSAPIGAPITVSSALQDGATVTVHGSGFNTLTVINLFAQSGGVVVNAGGFQSPGTPRIPLTIVNDTELTFTVPGGLDEGPAYVQAINPPFIPYTTSPGDGGSFWLGGAMVLVPGGPFTMGAIGLESAEPVHTVSLAPYWIDRTEVTVDAYGACVVDGACTVPLGTYVAGDLWKSTCNWGAPWSPGDHPLNCVTWNQAQTYCAWAGKRFPTEAEWEKAARDADARTYPWGAATATCDYAVMSDASAGGAGCGLAHTAPVGSQPAGVSPYGALDMAGNVWEWVSDWYDPDYYAVSPASNPPGPTSSPTGVRGLRGGSWGNPNPQYLQTAVRFSGDPAQWSHFAGFRCARNR